MTSPELYDEDYYDEWTDYKKEAGLQFRKVVVNTFSNVSSCVDLGCGDGNLTKPLENDMDLVGYDFSESAIERCVLNECYVKDLREELEVPSAELCISIEVVEHISEEYANVFAENVCKVSDSYALISTATPGQGGVGHVNEQPRDYWLDIFFDLGMVLDEEKTGTVKNLLENETDHSHMDLLFDNIYCLSKGD